MSSVVGFEIPSTPQIDDSVMNMAGLYGEESYVVKKYKMTARRISQLQSKTVEDLIEYFGLSGHRRLSIFQRNKKTSLNQHMFYKLVQGGSVDTVSEILDDLKNGSSLDKELYSCLLNGTSKKKEPVMTESHHHSSIPWKVANIVRQAVVYVLLLFFYIILTPVFYIVHSLLFLNVDGMIQKQLTSRVQLPLVFALMSGKSEMVRLFAKHKPDIVESTDEDGNTVFHYLCQISVRDPSVARSSLEKLLEVFDDRKTIHRVMTKLTNAHGVTGFEACFKNGSLVFLEKLVECEGIIRFTEVSIAEDGHFCALPESVEDNHLKPDVLDFEETGANGLCSYTLAYYDVSRYEAGDFMGRQSFPFSLILGRELEDLSEQELSSLSDSGMLNSWIRSVVDSGNVFLYIQVFTNLLYAALLSVYVYVVNGWSEGPYALLLYTDAFTNISNSETTTTLIPSAESLTSTIAGGKERTATNPMHTTVDDIQTTAIYDDYPMFSLAIDAASKTCQKSQEEYERIMFNDDSYEMHVVQYVLIAVTAALILSDVFLRLMFLTRQFFKAGCSEKSTLAYKVRKTVCRRMPVSYAQRQLRNLTCVAMSITMYLVSYFDQVNKPSFINPELDHIYWSLLIVFIVISAVFSFFTFFYSLRNLPIAGSIVMTMCKMAKVIIRFAAIYVIVNICFALLFSFMVKDNSCSLLPSTPFFTDIITTCFTLFRAMMGDNHFPESMSAGVILAYIVYMVLSVTLLLSLLTGVSSTVAGTVMSPAWKKTLRLMERLEEVLDADALVYSFTWPVYSKYIRGWRIRRSDNLKMKRFNGNEGVFIEVETLSC